MGIRSTNPTQSFGDEQNVRSVGNPFSAFNDFFSGTGKDAARQSHPGGPVVATGGQKVIVPTSEPAPTGGGYVYHIFTDTSAPATFEVEHGTNISLLLVGGGGEGNYGGAGGGGIAYVPNFPTGIPASGGGPFTATIEVGGGGGQGPTNAPTARGGDSKFIFAPPADPSTPITITALGGGDGGASTGQNGGSGGGAGRRGTEYPVPQRPQILPGGSGQQPSQNSGLPFSVLNYGNSSSSTIPKTPSFQNFAYGGGGAGAAVVGSRNGGNGQPIPHISAPTLYNHMPSPFRPTFLMDASVQTPNTSWQSTVGTTGIFGGGGGGHNAPSTSTRPTGGSGGGGTGGYAPDKFGNHGRNYTGGGGGGYVYPGGLGGEGGHGIVIVYYYVGD